MQAATNAVPYRQAQRSNRKGMGTSEEARREPPGRSAREHWAHPRVIADDPAAPRLCSHRVRAVTSETDARPIIRIAAIRAVRALARSLAKQLAAPREIPSSREQLAAGVGEALAALGALESPCMAARRLGAEVGRLSLIEAGGSSMERGARFHVRPPTQAEGGHARSSRKTGR